MKIIIVGGGIGGLCAYHALKTHLSSDSGITFPSSDPLSITILESHLSASRTLGGGLGLSPNGQRAIASIYPPAIPYLTSRAFPGSEMTMRNSKGSLLGTFKAGRKERYGYGMLMLPRSVVHEALLAGIPEEDIRWGVKVVGVRESRRKVELEHQDGTKEKADLVIGADGVRSAVKNSLFNDRYEAVYDGLTGVGGFIPFSELPTAFQQSLRSHGVTMTFGRKGFFGYSICSPLPDSNFAQEPSQSKLDIEPFIQWWSIYECPTLSERKEDIDFEALKNQLLARHGNWKSPYDEPNAKQTLFRCIIELGCRPPAAAPPPTSNTQDSINVEQRPHDSSVMVLPRYITPRLPFWSNANSPTTSVETQGRIVLIGDAAHTMPPDVGQGASCAAEDAVVYALLLKHYLLLEQEELRSAESLERKEGAIALARAAKAYEETRKPHIYRLLKFAKYSGDAKKEMGPFGQALRDMGMRIACKIPESLNDVVFAYDGEAVIAKYLSEQGEKEKKIKPPRR